MAIMEHAPAHIESEELSRAERRERTRALFTAIDEATGDFERDRLREQVAELNMCVAEAVAHRYRGRGETAEDLEQVAFLGLVKSVNGYDGTYHKDFLTYAVPTIAGELKKHFRDHCWTVRPPRRIQDLQRKIATVSEELGQQNDHAPTTTEVADALHIDRDEVDEALAADGCFTPSSLDVGVGQTEETPFGDLIGEDEHGFDEAEARITLAPIVRDLDERDRDIIELRFFHEWTQERIAQELGVTQMQISRLIARIMKSMRSELESSTCSPET